MRCALSRTPRCYRPQLHTLSRRASSAIAPSAEISTERPAPLRSSFYAAAAAPVTPLDAVAARELTSRAAEHLRRMMANSLKPSGKIGVFFDTRTPIATLLAEAYRQATPEANVVDFHSWHADDVKLHLSADLKAGDLVVLIQSENFNLNDYRIRLELFKRGLKVVEHVHLSLLPSAHYGSYIDALGFDPIEDGRTGRALKERLDKCNLVEVESSGGRVLRYEGGMEPALLNLGDYTGMKNVGEVFTEPRNLAAVNGTATLFGYPSLSRVLAVAPEPFEIRVENGVITDIADSAPDEFKELLRLIRTSEGDALLREFGIGLNRAMGKLRPVAEMTAFERQQGVHFSVGRKHTVYKKPGINYKKPGQYHIDVYVDVQAIRIDGHLVFKDNNFL